MWTVPRRMEREREREREEEERVTESSVQNTSWMYNSDAIPSLICFVVYISKSTFISVYTFAFFLNIILFFCIPPSTRRSQTEKKMPKRFVYLFVFVFLYE